MPESFEIITDMRVLQSLIKDIRGTPTRILHDGVEYGVYQEFGTSRGVPPHPFFTPALEAVRQPFLSGWERINNLRRADEFVEIIGRKAQAIARNKAPVLTGALKNSIDLHRPEEMANMTGGER